MLYRSDALHALSPADVERFGGELRISDIVDLRSTFELESEGRGLLESSPIVFHHLPLFDGSMSASEQSTANELTLGDRYIGLLEMARAPIARVIEALAGSEAGAVYHCAAGKDRTGVISAVLLGVLGVPRDLIVADYALSSQNIDAIIARVMSMKGYEDTLQKMPADTLHAKPETMETVLTHIDSKYGSMAGYLEDILSGIGAERGTADRLREKCLE
jgi:protein-tyrosine phosphatase